MEISSNLPKQIQDGISLVQENKKLWYDEIIRETEHYYQGEMQQEQRAAWALAAISIFITATINVVNNLSHSNDLYSILALISLLFLILSGVSSIITLLPLRGIQIWSSLFGRSFRRNRKLLTDDLILQRFRHDDDWTIESYEKRLKQHFRSHFLRFHRKAYGVLWSSTFLIVGLILVVLAILMSFFKLFT